jgi:hypothetical protein
MAETKNQKDDESGTNFTEALKRIANAPSASSRAAVEASKSTKPSLHTRFVYAPAKGRA